MKSFYSILQVPTRPAGQEQLNIGLLLIGDNASYFRFSNKKLEFVKKLIPDNSYGLLRSYLFNLAEKIKEEDEGLQSRFRNTDFISYLAAYNNNLITFSKPTPIDIEVNEQTYQALFEKFIFPIELDVEGEGEIQKTDSLQKELKKNFYPRIKEHVNLDQVLTTKEIPSLLVPSVKVSFIGQNNIPVAGQGVDFEKSADQITTNISRLITLIKAFEEQNKIGQYYIIGREPNKSVYKQQHDNWLHIRNSNLVEFVDVSETEKVSQYIEQHNVMPFVEID
jgi:hypothetical protein